MGFKRYIKEGRGQGTGKDYVPWTKIHDFSSKGRATRIMGIKTGRIHHLHSDNQLRAFLTFEFNDNVIDIRESYPLLDVMEVIDHKENLRFDKFCDKETGEQLVICTNFVLTVIDADGNEIHVARTIKNSSKLDKRITFEKLEIERRYWEVKGVNWKVITDKQLPKQVANNLQWVRETLLEDSETGKEPLSDILHTHLLKNMDKQVKDVVKSFDQVEGIATGTGLYLFRYLIAKKKLTVNMSEKINLGHKVKDILL
ncbi:TnsA endonuclease-like protein [Aneurinibacillus soli]|uniref:Transposon Tn7 transposition protein TnsA n=1 Tax=Aneurinibacillus soli TaxID=1500254 RepID=A0A0U5BGB1_9BACL|nr:TnsA endonuclease N-terminal domain-containing protein [Aneurinibacillus soli]PYE61909.1 TnsA endonuclease-like protein [Aneurinibacillus soli]BAU29725.1 Transposon Tn7 transposition protein TnsA [Aneurinibacillus soli]